MTIRILHTADWHLGHTLHDEDRRAEHAAFLAWLLDQAERREIDALIVAGDIFDASNPPASAQHQWHTFLVQAWQRLPALQVVAVAGNHDSASRLEASAPVLDALGRLHVVGVPNQERVVVVIDGQGGERAWVVAMPFLRPADLPVGVGLVEGVRAVYAAAFATVRARRQPGQALLATGHCYMVGGNVSELSERKIQVGNQLALPVDVFDDDVDYVALGHLHLAQTVGGRRHVRYSGSPIPLSVDERRYKHGVVLASFEAGALAEVETLEIPRTRAVLRIPESGALPLAELLAAIAALPALADGGAGADAARLAIDNSTIDKRASEAVRPAPASPLPLLELAVKLDRPEPMLRPQVQAALADRAVRLVRLGVQLTGVGGGLASDLDVGHGLESMTPQDVFGRRYQQEFGADPEGDVAQAFETLVELAHDPKAADERRAARRALEA